MAAKYRSRRARLAALSESLRAQGQTWAQIARRIAADEHVNMRVAFRLAHGMSQREVATRWNEFFPAGTGTAGMSDKIISYWEKWPESGYEPSLKSLKRLARIYQCGIGDLIDGGDFSYLGIQLAQHGRGVRRLRQQAQEQPGRRAVPGETPDRPGRHPVDPGGAGGTEASAVGLTWTTATTGYDAGPTLVGAKLNRAGGHAQGEGGVRVMDRFGYLPNDEFALYGKEFARYGKAAFRLRVLTTGGFSPDGVTGLRPDMYEDFFRLHATGHNGKTVLLSKTGVTYHLADRTLRVLGLSDLGKAENHKDGVYYDDCYREDRDNYIDIILVGDEAAPRHITAVEIPSLHGGYHAFYNPGGPGPEPFPGVRYSAPGPPDLQPVMITLDNSMRVSRNP